MFFYEYPTLSYHLKAVFYFIWYFLLCFSEIPFTIDCITADTRYAFGNRDACQIAAISKRRIFNFNNIIGNYDFFDTCISNPCDNAFCLR